MLWASRNKHTSRHAAATHTKQKRERKRDCVCTQRRKNVGLKKHLIFHCISWAAWRKEGPLFLSKREEEKKTSFQEDSCLSQIDPRAAAAFAISNSPVFVSLRCSCSPPPTQCTLRGRRIRAQLTGRRLCCRRLCIHRRTHTHTQGLNIMKHEQYLGSLQQCTLAAHMPLFSAAVHGSWKSLT